MTFFLVHKYNTKLASSIETTSKYTLLPCFVRAKTNDIRRGAAGEDSQYARLLVQRGFHLKACMYTLNTLTLV